MRRLKPEPSDLQRSQVLSLPSQFILLFLNTLLGVFMACSWFAPQARFVLFASLSTSSWKVTDLSYNAFRAFEILDDSLCLYDQYAKIIC